MASYRADAQYYGRLIALPSYLPEQSGDGISKSYKIYGGIDALCSEAIVEAEKVLIASKLRCSPPSKMTPSSEIAAMPRMTLIRPSRISFAVPTSKTGIFPDSTTCSKMP